MSMIECEKGMNKLNAKAIVSLCHRRCSRTLTR